jgi:hypothetical protein
MDLKLAAQTAGPPRHAEQALAFARPFRTEPPTIVTYR